MLICNQENADLFSQRDDSQISVYTSALFEKIASQRHFMLSFTNPVAYSMKLQTPSPSIFGVRIKMASQCQWSSFSENKRGTEAFNTGCVGL